MDDSIAANLKSVEDLRNFSKIFPKVYRKSIIYKFLNQFTLQKTIRVLFDLGFNTSAFQLFEKIPGNGEIKKYINYEWKNEILKAIVSLKRWDKLQFMLGNQETFMDTFNFIKSIPNEEIKRNLNPRENLLALILLEANNTNLHKWTDDVIRERIRTTTPQNEFIINEFGIPYRTPFVKWMIYYVYNRSQTHTLVFSGSFQRDVEGWSSNSEFPSLKNELLSYRGDPQGLEELILEEMAEQYQNEFGWEMGENWKQDYLDKTDSYFVFPAEFPYVLYQYTGMVNFYLPYISFENTSVKKIDQIIDLFDRKDKLRPIRDYSSDFYDPERFILEEFGVII